MGTSLVAFAGLILVAGGAAQTTWIVQKGGGGGTLSTIQEAIDLAEDGDTVLVRAGTYRESLDIAKGVQIAAEPGVTVDTFVPGVTIRDVGDGKSLTLRGLQLAPPAIVGIRNCGGRVHLEDIQFGSTTVSNRFDVAGCAQVSLTRVISFGLPALTITRSNVVLMDCQLGAVAWLASSPGLIVDGGTVTMVGGRARGGLSPLAPGAAGIELRDGRLILAGRNTEVIAGSGVGPPASAVSALAGHVDVEPAVTFTSEGGAPSIGGSATVVTRRIPSLQADGLASLGTWQLDLHAPSGNPFCLFTSLPAPATATIWGELWFGPQALLALACGSVGPGDQFAMTIPLPVLPRGVPLVAQGAVAFGANVELTTPAVNIVE